MSERMPPRRRSADGARLAWPVVPARLAGLAVLTALALTACTTPDDPDPGTAFVTPAPPGGASTPDRDGDDAAPAPESDTSAADVAFIEAMVVHHEQAVELAGLAATRAADGELADLASRMRVTQAAEAESMRSWLERRRTRDGTATDHDHDVTMRGEISRSTLDRAAELDGTAFDALFLASMVPHHRGAIEMAEARLAEAGDSAIARWARAIATAQALEIDRMLEIEARLAG